MGGASRIGAAVKVVGAGGWDRLQRFVAAAEFSTIRVAATALGTRQSVLTTQINRLERDLGGKLLERAERGRSMALTALGAKVAQAVRQASGVRAATTGIREDAP